jgi:AcrR family transcriptional regulator
VPEDIQENARASDRRSRGRPLQLSPEERRQRLIGAAEHAFLDAGYAATSMDDVAKCAGMSKKTVYEIFATKEALFGAWIANQVATLMTVTEEDDGARPPGEVLADLLQQVASFALSPRQIKMHRLVMAEVRRSPAIAEAFFREGPDRCRATLGRWLALQCARGSFVIEDPEEAAGMLFHMVVGDPLLRLEHAEACDVPKAAIESRVRRAMDIFLNGISKR